MSSELRTAQSRVFSVKNMILFGALAVAAGSLGYTYYKTKIWPWAASYGDDLSQIEELKQKSPKALTGGDLTHFKFGNISFAEEAAALPWGLSFEFDQGDGHFERPFSAVKPDSDGHSSDGLGPLFNGDSCEFCHFSDGRAAPPTEPGQPLTGLLFRVSVPGKGDHGGPNPHPVYGGQLADKAIEGFDPEVDISITYEEVPGQYEDGTAYSLRKPIYKITKAYYGPLGEDAMISPRIAPHVAGLGLLDAISDADILANADPDDADGDGISGKANMVWHADEKRMAVGKYGWKLETPTIRQQSADAAVNDMGITSPMFPDETCGSKQDACLKAQSGEADAPYELTEKRLDEMTTYMEFIAIPGRDYLDHPEVMRGEELFVQAGCSSCHIMSFVTDDTHRRERLHNQKIAPFTDLLLHDMGPGLADHRPTFDADGYEWRTAPLWGIGMTEAVNGHTYFLHDGRARNLAEAILWHGGESEAAKEAFRSMEKGDRESLIKFLKSI